MSQTWPMQMHVDCAVQRVKMKMVKESCHLAPCVHFIHEHLSEGVMLYVSIVHFKSKRVQWSEILLQGNHKVCLSFG